MASPGAENTCIGLLFWYSRMAGGVAETGGGCEMTACDCAFAACVQAKSPANAVHRVQKDTHSRLKPWKADLTASVEERFIPNAFAPILESGTPRFRIGMFNERQGAA